jgi:hypothetical protein
LIMPSLYNAFQHVHAEGLPFMAPGEQIGRGLISL